MMAQMMARVSRFETHGVVCGIVSRPTLLAVLGALALATTPPVSAQAPPARQPGEIPYLPFRPVNPGAPTPAKPGANAAAKAQEDIEALKKDSQDLDAIRAEQKRAAETEARLRLEIESIGEDRRQLNQ
jgi:hypothetical protein